MGQPVHQLIITDV